MTVPDAATLIQNAYPRSWISPYPELFEANPDNGITRFSAVVRLSGGLIRAEKHQTFRISAENLVIRNSLYKGTASRISGPLKGGPQPCGGLAA